MKVAVTGASGFIGRSLCATLQAAGHEPIAFDPRLQRSVTADAVVHLAAIAHRSATRAELEQVNVGLARQVAEAAVAHGAALVLMSSLKVHGERTDRPLTEASPIAPCDPYAQSKARAEDALRAIPGLRLVVLRPPLVYGPGVKANFLALMRAIARGIPLPFASIRNRRSLVYVGNLAEAVLRCLGKEGTFLVSDGAPISTPALCSALGEALGRRTILFPFPPALLPGKLAASLEVDDTAIRSTLGWQPTLSLEDGLRATARWYRGR